MVDKSGMNPPERQYAIVDHSTKKFASLADSTRCFGLSADEALDALNELRGGMLIERP